MPQKPLSGPTTILLPGYTTNLTQSMLTTITQTLDGGSTTDIVGYSEQSTKTVLTFPPSKLYQYIYYGHADFSHSHKDFD
jgi:hypothetical protein